MREVEGVNRAHSELFVVASQVVEWRESEVIEYQVAIERVRVEPQLVSKAHPRHVRPRRRRWSCRTAFYPRRRRRHSSSSPDCSCFAATLFGSKKLWLCWIYGYLIVLRRFVSTSETMKIGWNDIWNCRLIGAFLSFGGNNVVLFVFKLHVVFYFFLFVYEEKNYWCFCHKRK